jgi:hypothetical protein
MFMDTRRDGSTKSYEADEARPFPGCVGMGVEVEHAGRGDNRRMPLDSGCTQYSVEMMNGPATKLISFADSEAQW